MGAMASQITSLTIVYSTFHGQIKENSKAPRRWPLCGYFTLNYPDKGPVTRKMLLFDDIIMLLILSAYAYAIETNNA